VKRLHFVFITCLTGFTIGCTSRQTKLHEISSNGVRLQIIQLENPAGGDPQAVTYKARLIPDKSLLDQKNAVSKSAMIYKMDSCFYLQSRTKKIYASLVQPIANGVSGTYEYLIEFETPISTGYDFIYQDRYLNQKKYSLALN
jgi:hypothetical protein